MATDYFMDVVTDQVIEEAIGECKIEEEIPKPRKFMLQQTTSFYTSLTGEFDRKMAGLRMIKEVEEEEEEIREKVQEEEEEVGEEVEEEEEEQRSSSHFGF